MHHLVLQKASIRQLTEKIGTKNSEESINIGSRNLKLQVNTCTCS